MPDIRIIPLAERPEFADTCAAWSYAEWGCHIPDMTLKKTCENYRERAISEKKLPLTAIALCGQKIAGMLTLKEYDHPDRRDLRPWVNSLYVHTYFRNIGVVEKLYNWIETKARDTFGYSCLYTFTGRSSKVYEEYGWSNIGRIRDTMGLRAEGDHLLKKVLRS
jgi:hypothetical protein